MPCPEKKISGFLFELYLDFNNLKTGIFTPSKEKNKTHQYELNWYILFFY